MLRKPIKGAWDQELSTHRVQLVCHQSPGDNLLMHVHRGVLHQTPATPTLGRVNRTHVRHAMDKASGAHIHYLNSQYTLAELATIPQCTPPPPVLGSTKQRHVLIHNNTAIAKYTKAQNYDSTTTTTRTTR